MSLFVVVYHAKKTAAEKYGAKSLATSIEANSLKMAAAMAVVKLEEEMPESSEHFFAPKIYAHRPGLPLPALNVLDDSFMDTHVWNEQTRELEAVSAANEPGEPIEFNNLSSVMRIAVLVRYGTSQVTRTQLEDALALMQDTPQTFDDHITEALIKTPSAAAMYPERILQLIHDLRDCFDHNDTWPQMKAFAEKWVNDLRGDRNDKLRTASGTLAGGGKETDRSPDLKHDFSTLDLEIALGIMGRSQDFDIYNISSSIFKRARDIVSLKEKPFPAWSNALRQTPGILDYSRAMIICCVKTAPADIPDNPGALQDYINRTLTETDHAKPDLRIVALACGQRDEKEIQDEEAGASSQHAAGFMEATAEPAEAMAVDSAESAGKPSGMEAEAQVIAVEKVVPATEFVQVTNNFQQVGEVLEKELQNKDGSAHDNLKIWRQVMRTDPRFTKPLNGTGYEGTSINAEYMFMRATELFGPIGEGWGFEVLEDRMLPGAPMSEAIYENNKFVGKRLLRDADGSLITEQNHSIKIRLWYLIEGDVRGEVEAYGATPYLYHANKGIKCDGEAQKKSLTDAIKKALSLLGFSADIWLGLYDMPEYKKEIEIEFDIKNASRNAEESTRIRAELDEKFKQNVETMRHAVTQNEVSKIATSLTRTVSTHLKSARETGNNDYAKYLEGRLRRLEEVKAECLMKLQEAAS
ncbi:hypothetical protein ABU178_08340 [Pantoea osteomyelitidis]|uniref:Uncharacterized protein n=1 Tax=Pantoea osteomyelitidis TaxID=3230026 RepID=A0ABW7PXV4_9GAMM